MSYQANQREIEAVTSLSSSDRLEYLLNKVADWEEVWTIVNDEGWGLYCETDGRELLPIWPAQAFASLCCTGPWSGYDPISIDIYDWMQELCQTTSRDIAAFPTPSELGVTINSVKLQELLSEKLEQY